MVGKLKTADQPQVEVWDLPVRLFHWGLLAAFATAFITAGVYGKLHQAAGYSVAALVTFRCFWGFIGSRHARFASFVTSPFAILRYIASLSGGHSARHLGHNPAGGLMIVALLGLCAALGITGYLQNTPAFFGDERLHLAHQLLAYFTVSLIPLHLAGVVVSSVLHRENLVGAMITGRKRQNRPGEGEIDSGPSVRELRGRFRAAEALACMLAVVVAAQYLAPRIEAQIETNARRAKLAAKVAADHQAKLIAASQKVDVVAGMPGTAETPAIAVAAAGSTEPKIGKVAAVPVPPLSQAVVPAAIVETPAVVGREFIELVRPDVTRAIGRVEPEVPADIAVADFVVADPIVGGDQREFGDWLPQDADPLVAADPFERAQAGDEIGEFEHQHLPDDDTKDALRFDDDDDDDHDDDDHDDDDDDDDEDEDEDDRTIRSKPVVGAKAAGVRSKATASRRPLVISERRSRRADLPRNRLVRRKAEARQLVMRKPLIQARKPRLAAKVARQKASQVKVAARRSDPVSRRIVRRVAAAIPAGKTSLAKASAFARPLVVRRKAKRARPLYVYGSGGNGRSGGGKGGDDHGGNRGKGSGSSGKGSSGKDSGGSGGSGGGNSGKGSGD